jgi:hypothetical protein
MAVIIRFTDADLLKAKTLEKGIYPAIVSGIAPGKPSNSGKSVNFITTFTITAAGPTMGKVLEKMFGTGINQNGVMGTLDMAPAIDFRKVQAATTGKPLDSIGKEIDDDLIINKSLDISVDVVTSEGNLVNTIVGYYPSGKGLAATATPF